MTVEPRYATFEDEDHSWCVVTVPGGDYVAWPEMTQADADSLVAILNAPPLYTFEHDHFAKMAGESSAPDVEGLDVERLARALHVAGRVNVNGGPRPPVQVIR